MLVHIQVYTKGFCSDIVQDCAGKSIFGANHILIIAYGQIALLLASMNVVWQVSAVYTGENSLGAHVTVSHRMLFVCKGFTADQHCCIIYMVPLKHFI